MPIYAYKCASCGHAKDVLRRMSDEPLTVCPACGESSFQKQVTAAGFQLKGSGWYVTDFRGGNNAPAPASDKGDAPSAAKGEAPTPAAAPADPSPAPAPAPSASAASSPPAPAKPST